MEKNEIKERVIKILSDIFQEVDADIIEYADLIDDLGMDSMTYVTVLIETETDFNIEVPDEALLMENFGNADLITDILDRVINIQSTSEMEAGG